MCISISLSLPGVDRDTGRVWGGGEMVRLNIQNEVAAALAEAGMTSNYMYMYPVLYVM